jgi:hypothetical protein
MPTGVGPLGRIYVWDTVPVALVSNNLATTQTPAAAGNLTLTAGKGAQLKTTAGGITVYQLDVPRAVSVSLVTAGTATVMTVTGYDVYGQPMSEAITTVAAATTNGKKAFFQITSVATSAATGTAVTVGTTDILGIPVRVSSVPFLATVKFGTVLAQDAGTLVVSDATNPATTTTGDVRGTYTPTGGTDGAKRLVAAVLIPGIGCGPNGTRLGALGTNQNLVS